jgi:hypothetical protein
MSEALTDLKYGPYTVVIEALIEKIETITSEQAEALYEARGDESVEGPWHEAWKAASDSGRYVEWSHAQDAISDAARGTTLVTGRYRELSVEQDGLEEIQRRHAIWLVAQPAASDAILALTVRDLITPANFNALYKSWASVMAEQMPITQTDFKYGPQTIEIESLIRRAKKITPEQAKALLDAYDDAIRSEAAWKAWRSAKNAEHSAGRVAMLEAALNSAWTDEWGVAWYAARYAALALLVRDLILPAEFDALYEPWASVMAAK